ncbi:hypothetical protein [Methylobacterium sp. Leaf118]|uniref:hypothetical protein n=1 Tax=Methylobacterium sp. Leaf118 TaxID=2876562 RepID=UPI001E40ABC1|nr:hypothetical protein [Methylobacterium sp. Leaf118]
MTKDLGHDVRRLRLEPSDLVVITIPQALNREQFEVVHQLATKAFDHLSFKPRVLVLDDGADLKVVSAEEAPALAD